MSKNTRNYKKGLIPKYCEIPGCTFTAIVTRHRIKPGRKGGKYVLGNTIGLCPNDHYLADSGYYSQYELFKLVWNRIKHQDGISSEGIINGYTQESGSNGSSKE